jgi:replicative DNA helicase
VLDSLPHNIEAEQALLGALLLDNRVYDRTSSIVQLEHFADGVHARIWERAAELIESGRQANMVTLASYFAQDPEIKPGLTVPQYLGRLAVSAATTMNAREYAEHVRDLSVKRRLIEVGHRLVADGGHAETVPAEVIRETENSLYELAEKSTYGRGSVAIKDIIDDCLVHADAAYLARLEKKPIAVGLPTGFRDIDRKLTLAPGNLVIIAGRPGMGKSALSLNIAKRVAASGVPVQYDSMEMSADELGYRLLSEASDLTTQAMKTGDVSQKQMDTLAHLRRSLRDLPLYIDDAGGLKIGQMAARARRVKRQRGIGLLVIDYLQLMAGGTNNRVADVTEITTGLKALAKDLQIPIIALSQLSRAVEQREDKRPQLSDLRESGSIEQDADVVMFVYREEYYWERANPKPEPEALDFEAWSQEHAKVAGKAEVIIAKNRHGPTSTAELHFDGRYTRFADLAREQGREVAP